MHRCPAFVMHASSIDLICKIILSAEQASHTAAFILKWTDGLALSPHFINIEPPLPQSLLQTLRFPCIGRHFLDLPLECQDWVVHGYDGVFLNAFLHWTCSFPKREEHPEQVRHGRMIDQRQRGLDDLGELPQKSGLRCCGFG